MTISCPHDAMSALRRVPDSYGSIQSAIDACVHHDTVVVANGTYHENVNFRGKNIVVGSEFLFTSNRQDVFETIIDGSQPAHSDTASCVLIISGEDETAELVGFTLTGGTGTALRDQDNGLLYVEGGGVILEETQAVVRNNLIIGNSASRTPGGISSAGGGGIRAGFSGAHIYNNVIVNNTGRYGGGVVVNFDSTILRNNIIAMNRGGEDYGGGGLWINGRNETCYVENNTIVGNFSSLRGGGIRRTSMNMVGTNNLVWGNRSVQIGAEISGAPANTICTYCCVRGGFAGEGNISDYPLFASDDLQLETGSPCINSGNPDASLNDPDGSRSDIGAYGGPGSSASPAMPVWPILFLADNLVEFVWDSARQNYIGSQIIENRGTGFLLVDSVTFGSNRIDRVHPMAFPYAVRQFMTDSVTFTWTPDGQAEITDTAFVYHNDTTRAIPLVLILHGSTNTLAEHRGSAWPNDLALGNAYPNPFNPVLTIPFSLTRATDIQITIHDVLGRQVTTIANERIHAGEHSLVWDAADFPSGPYVVRLQARGRTFDQSVMLLK